MLSRLDNWGVFGRCTDRGSGGRRGNFPSLQCIGERPNPTGHYHSRSGVVSSAAALTFRKRWGVAAPFSPLGVQIGPSIVGRIGLPEQGVLSASRVVGPTDSAGTASTVGLSTTLGVSF